MLLFAADWFTTTGSGMMLIGDSTCGLFPPLFEVMVRMVGSMYCDICADAGPVSPSPIRMTETGLVEPDWDEG